MFVIFEILLTSWPCSSTFRFQHDDVVGAHLILHVPYLPFLFLVPVSSFTSIFVIISVPWFTRQFVLSLNNFNWNEYQF